MRFDGYPSAHVIPSENTGDYETNRENIRTYAFTTRLFCETKNGGIEQAYETLEEVIDSVLDKVDLEDLKGSDERIVGIGLPANYTFINIFAAPGLWTFLDEDALVVAEVTIRVRISIDVS